MTKERFLIFQELPGGGEPPPGSSGKTPEVQPPTTRGKEGAPEKGRETDRQSLQETIESNDPLTSIPNVTPEKLKAAKTSLEEAITYLQLQFVGEDITPPLRIHYFSPERYLPLMIKESKLDNSLVSKSGALGYFQLTGSAVDDVNKRYGKYLDKPVTKESIKNPLHNCITGILFYHLSLDHYASSGPFEQLPQEQQQKIGMMIYNKGYARIKKLWGLSGKKTYDDFEKFLVDALAGQLGAKAENPKLILDKTFNVDYEEYPAITKYLELLAKGDASLQKPFEIDGKDTGLTLGQAGEMLRYGKIIEGIEKLRTVLEPENGETNGYKVDEITDAHGLWSMADELMKECQEEGIEGFDELEGHIERQNMRKILTDIIVSFNVANNPEFKDVPDDITGYIFKSGTKVFIPGKTYIRYMMERLEEKSVEDSVETKKEYEKPETKEAQSKIPVYTDATLEQGGQTVLKNKYGLKESDIPVHTRPDGKTELATSRWICRSKTKTVVVRKRRRKIKVKEIVRLTPKLRTETKYIILHSTISKNKSGVTDLKKAHYAVEKDGTITYVLDRRYFLDHAGIAKNPSHQARWNGDDEISAKSIGVEVVAEKGEEWNEQQYEAVKKLVHLLGSIYGIKAGNVLTHSQVAMHTFNGTQFRGRKSDPINIDWGKLDLPDNSKLIDQDVALGMVDANLTDIDEQRRNPDGDWHGSREDKLVGLREADRIARESGRYKRQKRATKPREKRERNPFTVYKVKKGDNLDKIARKFKTTVKQIKKDNPKIKGNRIYPKMLLKIRK